jgi:hypothetical protein
MLSIHTGMFMTFVPMAMSQKQPKGINSKMESRTGSMKNCCKYENIRTLASWCSLRRELISMISSRLYCITRLLLKGDGLQSGMISQDEELC